MHTEELAITGQGEASAPDHYLYAGLFIMAVAAFCVTKLVGPQFGLASDLIAIAGNAACGWSWLLVRSLFQPLRAHRSMWPLGLVLVLVATGAFLRLYGDGVAFGPRMVGNLGNLVSSALLLLAAIEPLRGLGGGTDLSERRFRISFFIGYTAVLVIAVVWVEGAPAGSFAEQWGFAIKVGCALFAVVGMVLAIWYRQNHPLSDPVRLRRRAPVVDTNGLGERLLRLMTDEAIYTLNSLRVADLARRLGEAEYKVTNCITGGLGFRNFNHMANHFRIEEAKRRLSDPAFDHLPILTIAFDCGFGSIGPFNRAFKAQTEVTPKQFRQTLGFRSKS